MLPSCGVCSVMQCKTESSLFTNSKLMKQHQKCVLCTYQSRSASFRCILSIWNSNFKSIIFVYLVHSSIHFAAFSVSLMMRTKSGFIKTKTGRFDWLAWFIRNDGLRKLTCKPWCAPNKQRQSLHQYIYVVSISSLFNCYAT